MATSTVKWSHIKPDVVSLNQSELIELVCDLFRISAENRAFLTARLIPDRDAGLEDYRKRIIEQFRTRYDFLPLRPGEARRAINEYCKVTSDIDRTVDLMITYLEADTE